MGGGVPMSPRCIVAGPPVHRKIEIEQSLGSANQDDRSGMRDFSYIVRRLGNLLDIGEEGGAQTEIQNLESHVRHLYTSARRANSDPLSKEYPPNADLRKQNPPMGAYTNLFRSHREESGIYAKFSISFAIGNSTRILPERLPEEETHRHPSVRTY